MRSRSPGGSARSPISRAELRGQTLRILNRGGWGNPDVLLVAGRDEAVVVKDYAARAWWVRNSIARWLSGREMRAYRRLAGVPGIPALLGRLDAMAIVLEYRPGVMLSRSLRGGLPAEFMSQLESSVRAMHERGVVHLDLRHRSNVLAGQDGRPVIIDFASAICVRPDRVPGRWLVGLLGALDLRAVEKWRVRLEAIEAPGRMPAVAPRRTS